MAATDDKKIIFSMVGLSKTIKQNNKQVLKNIYLSFFYGAKIGIIGLNGAGKSTLMKIIAGLDNDYQGEVVFSPGYTVGYLPQDPHLDDQKTVKEIVQEGVQNVVDALAEYEEINQKFGLPEYYEDEDKMNQLSARQGELQDILDATDAWNLDSRLERAMDALRLPPADQTAEHLSGGERRRVALCRLLLQKPDVLLLDEPTNHLDIRTKDILKEAIKEFDGTVIVVSHDRDFLDGLVDKVYEFGNGLVKEHLCGIYEFLEYKKLSSLQELEKNDAPQKDSPTKTEEVSQSKLSYLEQKEAQKRIRHAEKRIKELETKINTYESEIKEIENLLSSGTNTDQSIYTKHQELNEALENAMMEWETANEEFETLQNND